MFLYPIVLSYKITCLTGRVQSSKVQQMVPYILCKSNLHSRRNRRVFLPIVWKSFTINMFFNSLFNKFRSFKINLFTFTFDIYHILLFYYIIIFDNFFEPLLDPMKLSRQNKRYKTLFF